MTAPVNDTSVLAIGGRTYASFGDRKNLYVRVGHDTRWEWRTVTDAEYQTMLDALNAPPNRASSAPSEGHHDVMARASWEHSRDCGVLAGMVPPQEDDAAWNALILDEMRFIEAALNKAGYAITPSSPVNRPIGAARQTAFQILTKHPDCLRDDVSLNDLIEDIAEAIQ